MWKDDCATSNIPANETSVAYLLPSAEWGLRDLVVEVSGSLDASRAFETQTRVVFGQYNAFKTGVSQLFDSGLACNRSYYCWLFAAGSAIATTGAQFAATSFSLKLSIVPARNQVLLVASQPNSAVRMRQLVNATFSALSAAPLVGVAQTLIGGSASVSGPNYCLQEFKVTAECRFL